MTQPSSAQEGGAMGFRVCTRCVLEDSPRSGVTFDADGVCNNCRAYDRFVREHDLLNPETNRRKLQETLARIKKFGRHQEYDCVLGISGGMDSTYLAYRAKELGLRPLVVHFDNGWDSELAVQNIHNIVEKLGFDLNTYVIDWDEFKDLQLAYLKASVIDIEVPTDHFIYATLHEVAFKHNILSILDGNNVATEFWGGSWKWGFSKTDLVNLENIHKKFGTVRLTKYPKLGKYQRYFYHEVVGIQSAYLLNYAPYVKKDICHTIETQLGWRDPGGKHYESVFTRFYQGYILPVKFGVDKRRGHFSNLIWSGQMTRDEALQLLSGPTYPPQLQAQDRDYFLKKFDLTSAQFEAMMAAPLVEHETYGTEADARRTYSLVRKVTYPARLLGRAYRKLRQAV